MTFPDNNQLTKLEEMTYLYEPWGLFEPHIWRDKIGDSLWHCYLTASCGRKVAEGSGETMGDAIDACYRQMRPLRPLPN